MDSSADRPAKTEGKGEYYPDYAAKKIIDQKQNHTSLLQAKKIVIPISPDRQE